MSSLTPLLRNIETQFERAKSWSIEAERIPDLLDIDPVVFYRSLYSAADRPGGTVEHGTMTRTFGPDSAGELVDVLELVAGERAERELTDLGAFLPHPLRVELISQLFETTHEWIRAHTPDLETFRAMLRTFGGYERARDCYLAEFFSRAELIDAAARTFVESRSFRNAELAVQTASNVLQRLFRSHIVELSSLFGAIGAALFEAAVESGFARRPEDEYRFDRNGDRRSGAGAAAGEERSGAGRTADPTHAGESELAWAREVMGLTGMPADFRTVQRRYKQLMLRYHPDMNPAGLRVAQRINSAYGILLAACRSRVHTSG